MKRKFLRAAYFCARPFIYLALHNSQRSRVFVVCDDSVLLIRSDFGSRQWTLPGGGIKHGEKPVAGAQRELFEEVGIRVSYHEFTKIAQRTKDFGPFNWPRIHLLFFVVRLETRPTLDLQKFEVTEAQWAPVQALSTTPDIGPTLRAVHPELVRVVGTKL